MTNNEIAEKLIRWIVSIKYYKMFKADGRQCAIEDLRKIREEFGFESMRKAYKHSACTGINEFRMLCREISKSLNK
jgi:hypothetical protein